MSCAMFCDFCKQVCDDGELRIIGVNENYKFGTFIASHNHTYMLYERR